MSRHWLAAHDRSLVHVLTKEASVWIPGYVRFCKPGICFMFIFHFVYGVITYKHKTHIVRRKILFGLKIPVLVSFTVSSGARVFHQKYPAVSHLQMLKQCLKRWSSEPCHNVLHVTCNVNSIWHVLQKCQYGMSPIMCNRWIGGLQKRSANILTWRRSCVLFFLRSV